MPADLSAQSSSGKGRKERHVGRIIGSIGGAFGGMLLGWAISDDDATDSTQKLVRNAALCAAAGGVGGYFLGRAVDKRLAYTPRPDTLTIRQAQARATEAVVRESAKFFRPPPDAMIPDRGNSGSNVSDQDPTR